MDRVNYFQKAKFSEAGRPGRSEAEIRDDRATFNKRGNTPFTSP